MAIKQQKNLRIDMGIAEQFAKICKKNGVDQNSQMEDLMKQYIARDGQILFDDIYAPRIEAATERAMDKQITRMIKMLNKVQIDSTASLYSHPAFYNQTIKGIEDVLNEFLDARVLNPHRTAISSKYSVSSNGKQAVRSLRNIALTDMKEQRKEAMQQTANEATNQ